MRHDVWIAGPFLTSVALAFGLATAASAQTYVVDADGGADFDDVQTALDAVPAGSTLIVHGEWMNRIFVSKSVTVVGLRMSNIWEFYSMDVAAIEIDAGSGSHVTFDHLDIHLTRAWTEEGVRGINVWSVGDLVISDSSIECSTTQAYCEYYTRNGDGVVIHGAESVSVLRSAIAGGSGWRIWFGCNPCGGYLDPSPRGGHAVLVEGSVGLLLIEDSLLQGGAGCEIAYDCAGCYDPPSPPRGGNGGNAIDDRWGTAFLSNCELVGGKGARGWSQNCDPPLGEWGGNGVELTGAGVDLVDALAVGEAVLGKDLALVGRGFAPDRAAILFFGTALGDPIVIRQGTWFLGLPFLYLGPFATDASGSFRLHGELPADPAFSGVTLVLQASDGGLLSEPEIAVVRPQL